MDAALVIEVFFFFKQKTAYEIGTGDWSSDVCSSDLQKNQLPVTKAFKELAELIGDVNEAYFFDQIEVIVDRIDRKSVV